VELIVAFLTLLYNHILMYLFGESSLTVYAVIAYVNLFVFMMMQGVAQGMMHLVSLQMGGENETVAKGYFRMCMKTTLLLGLLFTGLSLGMPEAIVGMLLKADSSVFEETVRALRQFSISFLFVGFNIAIAGYFTARAMPIPSIVLALGRGFVIAPLALILFAFLGGGSFIWMAACVGEAICLVVSLLLLNKYKISVKIPQ
jgi:Na+-driven multidrug efflux pump